MNIATITDMQEDGTFNSAHGLLYQFYITFDDGTVGQANAKSQQPPYGVGAEVGYDITGQYPGGNKLKIYANPEKAQQFAQERPQAAPRRQNPPPATNRPVAQRSPQGTPAGGQVNGQTVGMAMKEALNLLCGNLAHDEVVAIIIEPSFWASVHEVASDIIRVSALLEKGKLARPVRDRAAGVPMEEEPAQGRDDPPPPAFRPQAGPGGTVKLDPEDNEDVPF